MQDTHWEHECDTYFQLQKDLIDGSPNYKNKKPTLNNICKTIKHPFAYVLVFLYHIKLVIKFMLTKYEQGYIK